MLCNIKSLTSRCLADGGHRWSSVSQRVIREMDGYAMEAKWSEDENGDHFALV